MKRLLIAGAFALCSCTAFAHDIVCGGGYAIDRNVTGSMSTGHALFEIDTGSIALYRGDKELFRGALQNTMLYAYGLSGQTIINYEFDSDNGQSYMLVMDMSFIGADGHDSGDATKLITMQGDYTCKLNSL
ncbi:MULTISPECIES: hypothetical protein [Klebsiella]|nr:MULTISPECIES: hypothetical protein [Klebsiella]UDD38278.1 hypothetical protein LGL98_13600 [Klebsiella africana]